jgi:DNA replication licensing factor MCM3
MAQGSWAFPTKTEEWKINLDGNLGKNFVTPRGLKQNLLNQLVRVQGIVTRISIAKTKLQKSYHYIEETKQGYVQNYNDQYQIENI